MAHSNAVTHSTIVKIGVFCGLKLTLKVEKTFLNTIILKSKIVSKTVGTLSTTVRFRFLCLMAFQPP